MERNIGDPVKKAFEAYRQACIEKDNAKRDLQQKTDYYQGYTQQLKLQIEDQNKVIATLKDLLSSATMLASDEASQKYPSLQKQEVESLSSADHHSDDLSCCHQMSPMRENMDATEMTPSRLCGASNFENSDVIDMFLELQGHFRAIQALTRKQTNYLRKISGRNNTANEQQFSIPVQCTDVTAERSEGPLGPCSSTAGSSRKEEEEEEEAEEEKGSDLALASLLGAGSEDGRFGDSLSKLSVRFPPSADCEHEFLNSAAVTAVSTATAVPMPVPHAGSVSSDPASEGVRGPQQLLWSPALCEATSPGPCADPPQAPDLGKCEFCNDFVPFAHMFSHLNSHCPTSNGH